MKLKSEVKQFAFQSFGVADLNALDSGMTNILQRNQILQSVMFTVFLSVGYNRVACEGQGMSINCGSSKVIDISYASYGRTENGVCGNGGSTNCHAGSSMSEARRECQGLQRCILQASNSVFGDPCGGTRKYLEVS